MNLFARFGTETDGGDLRSIHNLESPEGKAVLAIYEQAFPEAERDPIESIADSLTNPDPKTEVAHLRALFDRGGVVGFAYFASYAEYYLGFLKFIAVRADIRGKGYGPILLRDALRQVRADGRQMTGWPHLGLALEVERPETADNDQDQQIRERRIQFYRRNGAVLLEGIDYVAPPIAPGQPSLPFHLMFLRAVPKYGVQRWLRPKAVKALLIQGYGETPDSWFVRHALELRQRAKKSRQGG